MAAKSIRILMADDDSEDLEMMEQAIRYFESDVQFYKVMNGRAAIDYLESQPDGQLPHLIILDYNMPMLTGAQVLSIVCKVPKYDNILKVIFSTSSEPAHVKECLENGAIEYFVKPASMDELYAIAQKLISYCVH